MQNLWEALKQASTALDLKNAIRGILAGMLGGVTPPGFPLPPGWTDLNHTLEELDALLDSLTLEALQAYQAALLAWYGASEG